MGYSPWVHKGTDTTERLTLLNIAKYLEKPLQKQWRVHDLGRLIMRSAPRKPEQLKVS